jgi:hypothetical protein
MAFGDWFSRSRVIGRDPTKLSVSLPSCRLMPSVTTKSWSAHTPLSGGGSNGVAVPQ